MRNSVLNRKKRSFPEKTFTAVLFVLVALWGFSCASVHKMHTTPANPGNSSGMVPDTVLHTWFNDNQDHYLFNTAINLMKNHFSGLTVVKPLEIGNYRIIMMTETGMKILDMEFFPDKETEVHYIMEAIDRKILVKMLSEDISLILMNRIHNQSPLWYENYFRQGDRTAFFKMNNRCYYYTMEPGKQSPSEARMAKGKKMKIQVNYFGTQDGPDSIKLEHNNVNLSIILHRIRE